MKLPHRDTKRPLSAAVILKLLARGEADAARGAVTEQDRLFDELDKLERRKPNT